MTEKTESKVGSAPAGSKEKGKEYIWGTGSRKTAVARIRLASGGSSKILVNGKPFEKYFTTEQNRVDAIEPLHITRTLGKYDVFASVKGGGITGQAGAVRLGLARALKAAEPSLEPKLKEERLLSRDQRMKERKKFGRHGARRGTQFSKR